MVPANYTPGDETICEEVQDKLNLKIASYQGWGKDKQYREVWKKYNRADQDTDGNEWYCSICEVRLAKRENVDQDQRKQRYLHHPIKQRYFPSPYQIDQECRADQRAYKSRHDKSNLVPVCSSCHGRWEGWENGRPHIMTWLFSDITDQEMDIALWPTSELRDAQRTKWSCAESKALREWDYTCADCGKRSESTTKHIYQAGNQELTYTGRDVRAVHIVPPTVNPALAHSPQNLTLLCWDCLFGQKAVEGQENQEKNLCWKNASTHEWRHEFAPEV